MARRLPLLTVRVLCALIALCLLLQPQDHSLRAQESNPYAAVLALPPVLFAADQQRYRRIFELQEQGRWPEADRQIAALQSELLMGHVLAQRYLHPTAYVSKFEELRAWLERYADHPQAKRLYGLALRKNPNGADQLKAPIGGYLSGSGQEIRAEDRGEVVRVAYAPNDAKIKTWNTMVGDLLAAGDHDVARAMVADGMLPQNAKSADIDLVRHEVARAYLAANDAKTALALASPAASRSGRVEPRLNWTAGLAAWRAGHHATATRHFVALANAPHMPGNETARAAFWAARGHLVTGQPQVMRSFLQRAAASSDEFYGLLARALLGERLPRAWRETVLSNQDMLTLLAHPGARRALALADIGRLDLAERELRKLGANADAELGESLIALCGYFDLPAAQMRIAQHLDLNSGARLPHGLYPVPDWQPASGGFAVDRALVYAIVRAESAFDTAAQSYAGAIGVMQVMPETAQDMARAKGLDLASVEDLYEPETNLQFGQAYLDGLLDREWIRGNLIYLAASYNAGPTRTRGWIRALEIEDDPLLFIETIPLDETRDYVKKVLTNVWGYRARLDQPSESLQALAANEWPSYTAHDRHDGRHWLRALWPR